MRTSIAIRRATDADRPVLERLAALDSARTPSGEVLIAEFDGEPQAAIEIAGGAAIADPFRRTAHMCCRMDDTERGRLRKAGPARERGERRDGDLEAGQRRAKWPSTRGPPAAKAAGQK